jgi:hypothetical protein
MQSFQVGQVRPRQQVRALLAEHSRWTNAQVGSALDMAPTNVAKYVPSGCAPLRGYSCRNVAIQDAAGSGRTFRPGPACGLPYRSGARKSRLVLTPILFLSADNARVAFHRHEPDPAA